MNRLKLLMLAFVMCITLCACKDTAQTNDSDSLPSADQVSDQASDNQTEKNVHGTRTNPYHFREDIIFSTIYNEEIITYTMNFSEILQGYATRNLWENTASIDEDDLIIRATISVTGDFNNAIHIPIYLTLLDENFNEFPNGMPDTPVETVNGTNDNVRNVYCGGTYDVIFKLFNNNKGNTFSYIKLEIEDLYVDGETEFSGTLWIAFPSKEELSSGQLSYTGRGTNGEPIVGSWSNATNSSDCAVFYEDGTLKIIKGIYQYKGTWEYLEEEIELNSEDMLNPRSYIATMADSSFMAVIVFDNPNFGDGEKDNMVIVENSYSISSYTRDQ